MAQRLKRLPAKWETGVRSLGREDPLEKEMAIHSSSLAWKIPWMEKPSRLQSTGSQRVRHDWATSPSPPSTCWMGEPCGLPSIKSHRSDLAAAAYLLGNHFYVFIFRVSKMKGLDQWLCQVCPFHSSIYTHFFGAIPCREMFFLCVLLFCASDSKTTEEMKENWGEQ